MSIKILDIVWYKFLPARFGGQKDIEGFVTALAASFEVVVLCSNNNVPGGNEPYKLLPLLPISKTQFINRANWRLIKKICVQERITHICIEHPYYAWGAMYVKQLLKLPVIIHSHNIESERFKSLGKWWWKRMWKYEGYAYRKADMNLFKTNADKAYAIQHYKVPEAKCLVIPYCLPRHHRIIDKLQAASSIRQQYQIPLENKLLLFNGTLDYMPNAKAVERIYELIAPLFKEHNPDSPFTILISGRNELSAFSYLKELYHPAVMQIGVVENIDELMAAADVFINPVSEGGGIKTKIIEALGQHTTVVSFAAGAVGVDLSCTGKKLQACADGDYVQFVQLIVNSMNESSLTPQAFFEAFNWEDHVSRLAKIVFV